MSKTVFTKIRGRISKLLGRVIIRNYSYKPVGIYHTSKEYVDTDATLSAQYTEVYSKLVSTLNISEDLYKSCSEYMKPKLSVETTYKVVVIPGGRIHTDNAASVAIISADNKLIGDLSFSYNQSKVVPPEQNNIFRQTYFSKPKKVKGVVFTLLTGGSGINNYFHWLIDTLPRIHLLEKSGKLDKIDYFLVPSYRFHYQKDTLRLLGIHTNKIIAGEEYPHIQADTLIASTAPRGNYAIIPVWACQFLKRNFTRKPAQLRKTPLVYISRRDSAIRQVLNEEALIALLQKYGFQTFVLNQLSFEEQVGLFASANIIISPHGAGLVNLAFCQEGTKILEIFAAGYVKATYHDLSVKMDLAYYHLICQSKNASTAKKGMKLDMIVDLDRIRTIIDTELLPKSHNLQISEAIE